jgi:hypothetical protein
MLLDSFGRVGFYRGQGNPEDHPLPGVVRAICEYLGNDAGLRGFAEKSRGPWQWQTCALVHGVSGQGFHHSWGSWGPQGTIWGAHLMDMYAESFRAVGLTCRPVLKSGYASALDWGGAVSDDETEYCRWVVESIRKVKTRRPLVFVTHNPNIPVLADADRVFVLESDGAHARKAAEGNVDECRDAIVNLLEGGEQAFTSGRSARMWWMRWPRSPTTIWR